MKNLEEIINNARKYITKDTVWFDLETTGVDVYKDETVQFGGIRVNLDGTHSKLELLIKPSIPIPKEASDVHGITNEIVANKPSFDKIASTIYDFIIDADIGGFNNARFDVVLLDRQLSECGFKKSMNDSYIMDSYIVYKERCTRKLGDAYKFYTGEELIGAHDAMVDIGATLAVFVKQAEEENKKLPDISKGYLPSPSERIGFSNHIKIDESGQAVWGFGKNKVKSVKSDMSYVKWVMSADFPIEVKEYLSKLK